MSHINFEIPVTVKSLLEESYERYYVREVVQAKRVQQNLKEAKQLLKEEGVEYILSYFDTYISVILNISQLTKDVQIIAVEDLHRAMKELNRSATFILSDKEVLNDEIKSKYANIIKMIVYAYINMVIAVMEKDMTKSVSKKNKKSTEEFGSVNRKDVVLEINTILQQEIKFFWDPPVVEEPLINLIAEVCYNFIEKNHTIKSDKELCTYIFHIFGTLVTEYRYGTRFIYRMAETTKSYEHAVSVVSEGIKVLVESYNARSLVREFVKQITEWQSDEKYQNVEAARNCAHVLSEMAKLMPELMVEEVNYLTEYLSNESYTLRISILNVITEVILTTLSKPNLTDDERDTRDDFLDIISEHMLDISAFVRSRAIQNFIKLQKENILTTKMQIQVLENVIYRLRDKGSNVRKTAANCISSFLEHNPFGSELKLSTTEQTLVKERLKYEELKEKILGGHMQKVKEGEEAWNKIKDDVLKMMENNINGNNGEEEEFNLPKDQIPNIIKGHLEEKKYEEAFKLTRRAVANIDDYSTLRNTIEHANENEFFLKLMGSFYMDIHNQLLNLMENSNEDNQIINNQQELILYYEDAIKFLNVIEMAIVPMKHLLESVNISEVQEAVEFFTVTFKFNIDNAVQGILEMLNIMQRPESDRKLAITNALKAIFLETNASSMSEHTKIVVDRLIKFMKIMPFDKVDSFKLVIITWVNEGTLDNNIIEYAFQYFVKKQDVSNEISMKGLQLLTMVAYAKKTIVMKNLGMISELIFEKRGVNDMLILSETCKLIIAGSAEHQLITDTKPPFKVKPEDPMWVHLINILCNQFDSNEPFYNLALKNIIKLIYTLCSKPDQLCEEIIKTILKKLSLWNNSGIVEIRISILIRLCLLVGEVAVGQLNFLDETVYKEIKRRLHVASAKANDKNKHNQSKMRKDFSTASSSRRNATNSVLSTEDGDDSVLDGAQAVDAEAEFILNVLENNIVTSSNSLGVFAPFIEEICKYPNKFEDEHLQCVAVSALLKYMLVSSKCCANQIRLIFTTLEKSKYSEVKCTVIIFIGDLLERFPNVIEPWSEHLYNRLNDVDEKVQKTAFHTLANLLLRDMLLVKSYIGNMAIFISEENNHLSNMSKNFFNALATKNSHHLYNVLPDIFSHLITKELKEEHFRYVMKYLFELIKSAKHTENLVERLCIKFMSTEDEYICRNIAYCLSLLEYNDRAVKKFSEHFHCYKHTLHNRDVYAFIKQIINSWSKFVKTDVKVIITELEDKISAVFQTRENEDGDDHNKTRFESRNTFKKPKKPVPKSRKRIQKNRSSDDDEEEEEDNNNTSLNSSIRRKSARTRKATNNSMSDV